MGTDTFRASFTLDRQATSLARATFIDSTYATKATFGVMIFEASREFTLGIISLNAIPTTYLIGRPRLCRLTLPDVDFFK